MVRGVFRGGRRVATTRARGRRSAPSAIRADAAVGRTRHYRAAHATPAPRHDGYRVLPPPPPGTREHRTSRTAPAHRRRRPPRPRASR